MSDNGRRHLFYKVQIPELSPTVMVGEKGGGGEVSLVPVGLSRGQKNQSKELFMTCVLI